MSQKNAGKVQRSKLKVSQTMSSMLKGFNLKFNPDLSKLTVLHATPSLQSTKQQHKEREKMLLGMSLFAIKFHLNYLKNKKRDHPG